MGYLWGSGFQWGLSRFYDDMVEERSCTRASRGTKQWEFRTLWWFLKAKSQGLPAFQRRKESDQEVLKKRHKRGNIWNRLWQWGRILLCSGERKGIPGGGNSMRKGDEDGVHWNLGVNAVIQVAQKQCSRMKENIHKVERLSKVKLRRALNVGLLSLSTIPKGNDELL